MHKHPRWQRTLRIGLVGAVSSALIVSAAVTGAAASTPDAPVPPIPAAPASAKSDFAVQLEGDYVDPDRLYSADVRWWLGDASHTDETLLEQIQVLYDAGFRGVELCMQNDAGAPDQLYAYGSDMWEHKWNLMMNKMLDLGMSVYLTSGTHWATSNIPGLDPDSQEAMQNLTLGTGTFDAGATVATLPAPATKRAGARFVEAYAYRVVEGNAVDPESYVSLPVTQGADVWTQNVDWTVPSDGTYRIFAMWTQGTYQTSSPAVEPSYATNYFDERGVAALKDYWEHHYLADPELAAKIKEGDVQLFMDSLEITPGTNGITWWSEDMRQEFQERKGYDIMPYIFLMTGLPQVNAVYNAYIPRAAGTYDLSGDADLREKTINDFLDVLTQLYRERLLVPLKTWLNSVGIETRAQISYGRSFEISEPIMDVDYPETENFNQYNQVDIFRLHTGGAKLQNKVLSTETGAQLPQYASRQLQLKDFYSQYAAGIQRMIWHVWAADYGYGDFAWPGFTRNFYHPGTRHPSTPDYDEYNAHIGRIQQLMQTGKSRTDVGFIHNNWNQGMAFRAENHGNNPEITQMNWQLAHQGVYYRSTELQDNGYTYDYFSPDFLSAPEVSFDEQTKTIEPAGYKAIVVYQDWLDLDGAKKLLDWAKKGLNVVFLDEAATRTPFRDGDAELATVVAELKTLSTVKTADVFDRPGDYFGPEAGGYDDNVLDKLQQLGVEPTVGYPEPNLQLLTQTREDEDGNEYTYVYNYDDGSYLNRSYKEEVRAATHTTNITTDLVKDGTYVPYEIDAWTGEVTELGDYRWADGKTIIPIDLDYNDIKLLVWEKADEGRLHVIETDAASSFATTNGVAVRATESGRVTTELSSGAKYSDPVSVPESYDITGWDVTVESWTPNPVERDLVRTETIGDLTTKNTLTSTVKTPIDVELDTLTTWDNIPAVGKGVSGTAEYEASFEWDASSASGAYLDFGDLTESMKVWINGEKVGGDVSTNPTKAKKDVGGVGKPTIDDGRGNQVPLVGTEQYTGGVSLITPVIDVSDYLVDGENTIEITYASTLQNLQLNRGILREGATQRNWWLNDQFYESYGPAQAVLVPFVDVEYTSLDVDATPRTLGKNVYLSVSAVNNGDVAADIVIATPYGSKMFANVAPGKSAAVSLNTRVASIAAGEATITATPVGGGSPVVKSVPFGAFPTGG